MTPQEIAAAARAGADALARGERLRADAIADQLCAGAPSEAAGPYLKGRCAWFDNRPADARAHFERAASLAPGFVDARVAIGLTLRDEKRYADALEHLLGAHALAPGSASVMVHVGDLHRLAMNRGEAAAWYAKAHAADPASPEPLHYLMQLAELAGDLDAARGHAEKLLALRPGEPMAVTVLARAALADEGPEAAIACVRERFPADRLGSVRARTVHTVLGDAHHRRGAYAEAYKEYKTGADATHAAYAPRFGPDAPMHPFVAPEALRDVYRAHAPRTPAAPAGAGPAPAFLVGFPRSGTTLLEQVLAAHPDIATSNERANLTPLQEAAGDTPESLAALLDASDETVARLRAAYWARVGLPDGPGAGRVYLDKLPANAAWLGVIARVFPDAKVILALRDPRDCVVSAFRQSFRMNPAMYRMLTLEGGAAYYDALMGAAEAARAAFPGLAVLEARYEETVTDLEAAARRAVDFLGVAWRDEVLDYRARLDVAAVSTPSARRVAKPLDTGSIGVWRRYAFAMEAASATLAPWVARWGYDAGSGDG